MRGRGAAACRRPAPLCPCCCGRWEKFLYTLKAGQRAACGRPRPAEARRFTGGHMGAAVIGVVGGLAGVVLGAAGQQWQSNRNRKWQQSDIRRGERRDVYVRFLTAAEDEDETALQVGSKRTAIHTLEEGQQHWRDLSAARAKLRILLTELRLVADQPVYEHAVRLSAYLNALGNKALEGEAPPSRA
jgi:hypothetical protein